MRILQVIKVPEAPKKEGEPPDGAYGSQRSTTLLCQGLTARGHDVQLTCRGSDPTVAIARAAQVRVVEMWPRDAGSFRVVALLMKQAIRQKSDLLVAHDLRSSRLTALAGRALRKPVIATLRGLYSLKNYDRCDHIIAVSEGVRQYALEAGIAPDRVTTVHNGVDIERFTPATNRESFKKAAGFDADAVVVGLIGRMSHEKGHHWFFDAVAPLAREFPAARFLLVGDGLMRAELEAKASELGLSAQTRFVGYQSDILPWMSAMDILVLPSVSAEGFARVLIEAGALAIPAIASPVGGNAEAIENGLTGFIVPVNDVVALRDAVRELLSSPEKRKMLGSAARQRVSANFTVNSMVEATERIYREVARRH